VQLDYKKADDDQRDSIAIKIEKQNREIASIRKDMEKLLNEEGRKPVTAPIDGVLASFELKAGDTITAQTNIGEVVNYEQFQLVVSVDELDISKVKLDQQARIRVEALSQNTYTDKVVDIANEGTASNGVASFDVTIMLDETAELKAGMTAEASIQIAYKENVMLLPVEASQGQAQARGEAHGLMKQPVQSIMDKRWLPSRLSLAMRITLKLYLDLMLETSLFLPVQRRAHPMSKI